jgi:predicted alpha-1,6-mannanase (GH76 family)
MNSTEKKTVPTAPNTHAASNRRGLAKKLAEGINRSLVKTISVAIFCSLLTITAVCNDSGKKTAEGGQGDGSEKIISDNLAGQNLLRAMQLTDSAVNRYFVGDAMAMLRYCNPYVDTKETEKGSIWMYTASIEAVNAILRALRAYRESGGTELYSKQFERYTALLAKLYHNAAFYKGTFTLTSYTQTKEWSVYGVNRGNSKGSARVDGVENVYDDQQWLMRELIEAYTLTGNSSYLAEAEYLAAYVLDGWDCTRDTAGNEHGGIPWGPGYVTKHACSNGPAISPLVWLHELYRHKSDEVVYRYIADDGSRKITTMKKGHYYLMFAKAIYQWQKTNLLRNDGVYHDMMGGCHPNCNVAYEMVNGARYRKHTHLRDRAGTAHSYNCGSMLSGAADLYRATGDSAYLQDAQKLSDASFKTFATPAGHHKQGCYVYTVQGFANWFNGVLMRAFVDIYPAYRTASTYIDSFQKNLDYGYKNFFYKGFLPENLLEGWSHNHSNNRVQGMFIFAFAAEYATLARYELEKQPN